MSDTIDCPRCGGLGGDHRGPCDVCHDTGQVRACPACIDHPEAQDCPECGGTGVERDSGRI